jgi:TRAP-type C4-dicarboxylate transport system permease small subunit
MSAPRARRVCLSVAGFALVAIGLAVLAFTFDWDAPTMFGLPTGLAGFSLMIAGAIVAEVGFRGAVRARRREVAMRRRSHATDLERTSSR